MRANRNNTVLTLALALLIAATGFSYSGAARLIQGAGVERAWTRWANEWDQYTKVRDVIPVELVIAVLVALMVTYLVWHLFKGQSRSTK